MRVRYVLFTGSPERQLEARAAAGAFTPGADLEVELHDLPDGRLPAPSLASTGVVYGVLAHVVMVLYRCDGSASTDHHCS